MSKFKMWYEHQGSTAWLAHRNPAQPPEGQYIIPSSIVANIIGCGYSSLGAEYRRYTGTQECQKPLEGFWLDWGRAYEAEAIDVYFQYTKSCGVQPGTLRHDTRKWLWASCDQIMFRGGDVLSILEIKCPQVIPYDWQTDEKTWWKISKHIIQVQMQMEVTGLKEAYLFYYHPTIGCLELKIPHDRALVEHCFDTCEDFLRRVVKRTAYPKKNPNIGITKNILAPLRHKILPGMRYSFKQNNQTTECRSIVASAENSEPSRSAP